MQVPSRNSQELVICWRPKPLNIGSCHQENPMVWHGGVALLRATSISKNDFRFAQLVQNCKIGAGICFAETAKPLITLFRKESSQRTIPNNSQLDPSLSSFVEMFGQAQGWLVGLLMFVVYIMFVNCKYTYFVPISGHGSNISPISNGCIPALDGCSPNSLECI